MQEHNLDRPGSDDALPPAEQELERALRSLSPARPSLSRERVVFEAGRAAGEAAAARRLYAWRAAAAVLLIGLGLAAALRSGPRVVERERVVYLPAAATAATPQVAVTPEVPDGAPWEWQPQREPDLPASFARPLIPADDADYLAVRDAVLRWGV